MNRFYRWWTLALVLKLCLAALIPLSNDESYYWVWGHHLDWSYFDHPPMVGWLFALVRIFGDATAIVRWPGVLLGHATILLWREILKQHFTSSSVESPEERERFWLIFVGVSPLFGVGSIIITPDIPLVFFWSLALLLLMRMLNEKKLSTYLAFGAALGLGFISKYPMVLFVPIAFIWLFASGEWRKLNWSWVPLVTLVGVLFCAPVLYWNAKHEWASFAFQLNHGLQSTNRTLEWPANFLLGQIGLLFPTVVWLVARRPQRGLEFLFWFGWLPILFFLYTSFRAPAEANWPIMAHPALLSLAVLSAKNLRPLKWTAGIWLTVTLIAISESLVHWLPLPEDKLKTYEFHRYDSLILPAQKYQPFYLGSYQMAADVSFKLRRDFYKLKGMNRRDVYDFLPQSTPDSDRFWLGKEITHAIPESLRDRGFVAVEVEKLGDDLHIVEVSNRATNP